MAFDLSMPILVVDDYSTMIRIIRNLLKQIGFENVDDASDGSAALAKLQSKKYGLIISDWNMEPMTGYDLLKEVRASPEFSQTPFIMITAESKTENVIAAKKAGVNNYIVKPFNAATLKTKMEAVFPERLRPAGARVAQTARSGLLARRCTRPACADFARPPDLIAARALREPGEPGRTITAPDFHIRLTLDRDSSRELGEFSCSRLKRPIRKKSGAFASPNSTAEPQRRARRERPSPAMFARSSRASRAFRPAWVITIIPQAPKASTAAALRPAPRVRAFAEDFY